MIEKKENFKRKERQGKTILLSVMIMVGLFFMINLTSASLGVFKQSECVQIKTILNSSLVNISSLSYPNSTIAITQQPMTKVGSTFNYTFCNTTDLGIYIYDYYDELGNVYVNDFEITPTGKITSSSQGLLSIGIMFSVLLLMFFFGFLSFKFTEKDETFGFGLFFLVMSLILACYSLFLGYVLSRDFLFTSVSSVQEKIFVSALLSLTGITLIAFIFFAISVIKAIKIKKTSDKMGDGYNQKTKTYDY